MPNSSAVEDKIDLKETTKVYRVAPSAGNIPTNRKQTYNNVDKTDQCIQGTVHSRLHSDTSNDDFRPEKRIMYNKK